tara:strand:+ start:8993 stop:9199 length:207 start_codon:yes stop_codon:yes gene_type:complete
MKSFSEYISERLKINYRKGRKLVATKGSKEGETGTVVSMGPNASFVSIKLDKNDQIIQQNPKYWEVMK